MSSTGKMTRRYFLRWLVLLVSYGSTVRVFAQTGNPGSDNSGRLAIKLLDILGDKRSACIVGRKYLEKVPHETDPQQLVAMICSPQSDFRCDDNKILKKHVMAQLRDDFSNGRTVSVDGWVLSQTEARLYALASILQG